MVGFWLIQITVPLLFCGAIAVSPFLPRRLPPPELTILVGDDFKDGLKGLNATREAVVLVLYAPSALVWGRA